MLTPKQNELLCIIKDYMAEYGFSPTYDIMMFKSGLKSKSSINRLITGLEKRGFIRRIKGCRQAIEITREPEMYARRVDENQKEIVSALRKLGYSVRDTSRLGEGYPDLTIGKAGKNYLIEVKDGNKPPSARKLTPAEQKFKDEWRGQYKVIESVKDVLAFDMGEK